MEDGKTARPEDGKAEVRLSHRECQRLEVLKEVQAGNRTQVSAGKVLEVTDRWVRELLRRLKTGGPQALAHGNRGRASNRRLTEPQRHRILQAYRQTYRDFNLTHFREKLQQRERIEAPSRETLRQILMAEGLWNRRREAPKHRLRRPRREREGELMQVDASLHAWFGEGHPPVALVGGIDDATGDVPSALFYDAETTEAYFGVLGGVIRHRGVPQAIYGDRDSVFVVNDRKQHRDAQAQGRRLLTQFGRALKELGIDWIAAFSPQAKGRIERLWGTFQDRLLHELRLEGIHTIPEANIFLTRRFLPAYNRQFRRPAAVDDPIYRPAPSPARLAGILCWKETRILARDHTFPWRDQVWQVLPSDRVRALAGRRLEIRKTLRGELQAWYGPVRLSIRPAPKLPPPLASLRRVSKGPRSPSRSSRPSSSHPWRRRVTVLLGQKG